MKLGNKKIAEMFRELGMMLEILGENPFKIRAYTNAAKIIEELSDDIQRLSHSGELMKIDGIGEAIAKKIIEIVETGELPKLEEAKKSIPPGLLEMLRIPVLTPRKINLIWKKLEMTSLKELEKACSEDKLLRLRGFNETDQQELLQKIRSRESDRIAE